MATIANINDSIKEVDYKQEEEKIKYGMLPEINANSRSAVITKNNQNWLSSKEVD